MHQLCNAVYKYDKFRLKGDIKLLMVLLVKEKLNEEVLSVFFFCIFLPFIKASKLKGMVLYCIVLYGIVWYGMVWYGMVWYGMT